MTKYDYEAAIISNNRFIRMLRLVTIWVRKKTRALILISDRVLHDPEYRVTIKGKLLRPIS